MRVLGIDCGSEYTGYGVVEEITTRSNSSGHQRLVCCGNGVIHLRPRDPMALKLQQIFSSLSAIIAEHQPKVVAIEDVFYALNVKSALKLGQVRGVAMLAASWAGLDVAEYAPLTVKSAVAGYGRAEKTQVQHMVMRLLNLQGPPLAADAADALAIAICHIHTASTTKRYHMAHS
jgi:crossover junction endodeoxyribonuclease RuvC